MNLVKILKGQRGKQNLFELGEYYDLERIGAENLDALSDKDLAKLRDTRDLWLGPTRIADGISIYRDGRFSTAIQVGTVNFILTSADEQKRIVSGYHAVLLHLSPNIKVQIKIRMVDADLEPLAERVDYALRRNHSPELHRLALNYKQFLRTLPRKRRLMERRNYLIVSITSERSRKWPMLLNARPGECAACMLVWAWA